MSKVSNCLTQFFNASKNAIQAEGILRFPLEEKQFVFSYKKVVIMKKTLAAVAVLGAFAGSALAADVTLYGKVDLGLQYVNSDVDQITDAGTLATESVKSDKMAVKSGSNSGSRWGIKGTEQISEGLTVGFQLEGGFDADTGKSAQDGRLFGRESRLYVTTDFGEIAFGRMGGLDSGSGSYDIVSKGYAMSTGWGDTIGKTSKIFLGQSDRFDNMITYKSPTFAGVTVYAQASLQKTASTTEVEGSSDTDRYYALGATGNWGALSSALVFSTTDYSRTWVNEKDKTSHERLDKEQGREDMSKVVTGYVAYDFGMVKPMLSAQYFDDVKGVDAWEAAEGVTVKPAWADYSKKGYGVMLGATAPVGAGTLFAMVGYSDYETTEAVDEKKVEFDAMNFGLGYQYPLSKRTYVYTAAGYTKINAEWAKGDNKLDADNQTTEVVAGIVHNF